MKLSGPLICRSAQQTIALGRKFAKTIEGGDVIALEGDLGCGKTTFIKGIALGLGVKDKQEITSPTFALMHIYQAIMPIYHFDLYRLENTQEILSIGFDEFVSDPKAVICIEWADRARDLLPADTLKVRFKITGPDSRRITLPFRK